MQSASAQTMHVPASAMQPASVFQGVLVLGADAVFVLMVLVLSLVAYFFCVRPPKLSGMTCCCS